MEKKLKNKSNYGQVPAQQVSAAAESVQKKYMTFGC